jgi:hypothetical protein
MDNLADTNIVLKFTVTGQQIEKQSIVAIGNYTIGSTKSISVASVDIIIKPVGKLLDFKVDPEIIVIEKDKSYRPTFGAVFEKYISKLGPSDSISVIIANPEIVSYNPQTNYFTGVADGKTYATVTYRSKSAIVVIETIGRVLNSVDGIDDIHLGPLNKSLIDLKTYPNPFNEKITFEYTLKSDVEVRMDLYTISGQKVKSENLGLHQVGLNCSEIDLSNVPPCVYIYNFKTGNEVLSNKIIKQKH